MDSKVVQLFGTIGDIRCQLC